MNAKLYTCTRKSTENKQTLYTQQHYSEPASQPASQPGREGGSWLSSGLGVGLTGLGKGLATMALRNVNTAVVDTRRLSSMWSSIYGNQEQNIGIQVDIHVYILNTYMY